jgi:hypothetical protein
MNISHNGLEKEDIRILSIIKLLFYGYEIKVNDTTYLFNKDDSKICIKGKSVVNDVENDVYLNVWGDFLDIVRIISKELTDDDLFLLKSSMVLDISKKEEKKRINTEEEPWNQM